MIGIGLDAVTEELFRNIRTNVPAGGLKWEKYWEVVTGAREIFGPWKVNVHTLVGLGETRPDLIELFTALRDQQIFSYLFCFNPEPDSRMADHPKSPLARWRRVQLAKHLIETEGYDLGQFDFDDDGGLVRPARGPRAPVEAVVGEGVAFMTNGCPGEKGEPGCTRPYGSYRPGRAVPRLPVPPFRSRPGRDPAAAAARRSTQLDKVCMRPGHAQAPFVNRSETCRHRRGSLSWPELLRCQVQMVTLSPRPITAVWYYVLESIGWRSSSSARRRRRT